MATEYASSPVAQPGTQMRMGESGARFSLSAGKTRSLSTSYDSGSRKKRVTWMSRSWYRFTISPLSCSRSLM